MALEPPSPGTPPAVAPATVTAFSSSSSSFSAPLVKQPLVVCETQPAVLTTSPSAPAGLPHIVFQAQPSPSSMPTSLKVPLPLSQLHGGGVSSASATPLMTSAGGTQAPAAHAPQRGSRKGRGRPTSRDVVFSSPRSAESRGRASPLRFLRGTHVGAHQTQQIKRVMHARYVCLVYGCSPRQNRTAEGPGTTRLSQRGM